MRALIRDGVFLSFRFLLDFLLLLTCNTCFLSAQVFSHTRFARPSSLLYSCGGSNSLNSQDREIPIGKTNRKSAAPIVGVYRSIELGPRRLETDFQCVLRRYEILVLVCHARSLTARRIGGARLRICSLPDDEPSSEDSPSSMSWAPNQEYCHWHPAGRD